MGNDVHHEEQEDRASCSPERETETAGTANVEDALITTPPLSGVSAQLDMIKLPLMFLVPPNCCSTFLGVGLSECIRDIKQ